MRMAFADILEDLGSFGRFQFIHVTLLSIPGLFLASQNILNNFTGGVPGHHCTVPNRTSLALSHDISVSPLSDKEILQAFIPTEDGSTLSRCRRYTEAQWRLVGTNGSIATSDRNVTEADTETCRDGWTYEKTEFLSTIVTEWDLVCTLLPLKRMSQTIYMGGVLTGAIVFGGLSDRFGRRALLIWSHFQLATLGCCTALSTNYLVYCIFRFLTGMSVSGVILNAFSLRMEWVPTKTRAVVVLVGSICFTTGQMILAGVAYCLRDWRHLQVAVSAPHFIIFIYSWWFPESARWLVVHGRSDKALKEIHRVARINRKPEMIKKITLEILESHMQKEIQSSTTVFTAIDLLRTPVIRKISFCLMFAWFSTSFAYYGLVMDLQKFGVNVYLVQLIFGAVDIPAKLGVLATLNSAGRRLTQTACLLLSAAIILVNIFVPKEMQMLRTSLAVLGKGFTSASFSCVYLYTGELYPTVIRQTGMGFSSTMARIGSMAAPVVLILADILPALPSIIYGGSAVMAGILAIFLPETRNIPLPDTIEDVEEKWAKSKKKGSTAEEAEKEMMNMEEIKEFPEAVDGKVI